MRASTRMHGPSARSGRPTGWRWRRSSRATAGSASRRDRQADLRARATRGLPDRRPARHRTSRSSPSGRRWAIGRAPVGFDLTSEPARRSALQRARATRRTVFTRTSRSCSGGRGFQALPADLCAHQEAEAPVGVRERVVQPAMIANAFSRLPTDVRARVRMGDTRAVRDEGPPRRAARTRSISLGGRTLRPHRARRARLALLVDRNPPRWGDAGAHARDVHLGADLVRAPTRPAHDAERAARERSELLEHIASRLAIAETAARRGGVDSRRARGIGPRPGAALPQAARATSGSQPHGSPLGSRARTPTRRSDGVADEAMRNHAASWRRRRRTRTAPRLPSAARRASPRRPRSGRRRPRRGIAQPGWLVPDMRAVVVGVAEQCGVALERARLSAARRRGRRRADILQRLAASLSAAALPTEVAEASIPFLFEAFGAALVHRRGRRGRRRADAEGAAGLSRRATGVGGPCRARRPRRPPTRCARARRSSSTAGSVCGRLYPPDIEQLLAGVESMLVVPLPRAIGGRRRRFRR